MSRVVDDIEKRSMWSIATAVVFHPKTFLAARPEPFSFRASAAFLVKIALAVSLINALLFTAIFYVVTASFIDVVNAFIAIFGTLLTPLIAVAANIPPETVPQAVAAMAKNGGAGVSVFAAKLGAVLFAGNFVVIVLGTTVQTGIAHVVTRLLGGSGSFRATASAYCLGSVAFVLTVVPLVNLITPLYAGLLYMFGVRQWHQLSTPKATVVVFTAASVPLIALLSWGSVSH